MSEERETTPDAVKARFKAEQGYWIEELDDLLELDPEFVDRYAAVAGHTDTVSGLSQKERALIQVVLHSSVTTLGTTGLRTHIGAALDQGATVQEVLEVLELTSTIGIHSASEGFPTLASLADDDLASREVDEELRSTLLEEFEADSDYYSGVSDGMRSIIEHDPAYFEQYKGFFGYPWETGTLDAKLKELSYIAMDISPTDLFEKGLKTHIRNALQVGASPEEIMEVIELASLLGINTAVEGVPILAEEARERDLLDGGAD